MEAEERPSKVRKLTQNDEIGISSSTEASNRVDGTHETLGEHIATQEGPQDAAASIDAPRSITDDTISTIAGILTNGHCSKLSQSTADDKPLSKNQQKKLRKKQEWEAKRDDRKIFRKEKAVQRRERKKAAKEAASTEGQPETKPQERILRKQLPVTIVIDCDFDHLMHDGERISLSAQVTRCYSDNKNARFRAHLTVSSFGGTLRERYEHLMDGVYKNWRGVRFLETDFVDASQQAKSWMSEPDGGVLEGAFEKYANDKLDNVETLKAQGEIVYLSSEADETLDELKPYSTYIIGGLVDKNREKGLCHKRATERGIRTARLPISEYLEMSARRVLTVNQVSEIMINWLEHQDWGKAFITAIPQRKGGKLKSAVVQENADGKANESEGAENEDDEDERQKTQTVLHIDMGRLSHDRTSRSFVMA